MAPPPAWRSPPPVTIYPRSHTPLRSVSTWIPHILKALLAIGLVLIWMVRLWPILKSENVVEFGAPGAVNLGLVGIIQ